MCIGVRFDCCKDGESGKRAEESKILKLNDQKKRPIPLCSRPSLGFSSPVIDRPNESSQPIREEMARLVRIGPGAAGRLRGLIQGQARSQRIKQDTDRASQIADDRRDHF